LDVEPAVDGASVGTRPLSMSKSGPVRAGYFPYLSDQ